MGASQRNRRMQEERGDKMTYWEAADILEHGSLHYGKIQEATAIALMVLKDKIKELDEAEIAEFREVIKDGPTE